MSDLRCLICFPFLALYLAAGLQTKMGTWACFIAIDGAAGLNRGGIDDHFDIDSPTFGVDERLSDPFVHQRINSSFDALCPFVDQRDELLSNPLCLSGEKRIW